MSELANHIAGAGGASAASPSSHAANLKLRVAEARIQDIGHGVARLSPADLRRVNAKPGDVLRIVGSTIAVARAEVSSESYEGMIQIDGTCRSNCGAGLQEQVAIRN